METKQSTDSSNLVEETLKRVALAREAILAVERILKGKA